jgi:catechol 2,3-dioxygenase-like lactoylglutathione lyase family enzyme
MAKIRHVAIRTEDPESLATFYRKGFGLKEIGRGAVLNGLGAIYLSDGYINLAIIPSRGGQPQGIDHFGFEVESIHKQAQAASEAGASKAKESPRDGRFAEFFLHDLVGTRVDLSEEGWKV